MNLVTPSEEFGLDFYQYHLIMPAIQSSLRNFQQNGQGTHIIVTYCCVECSTPAQNSTSKLAIV